VRKRPYGANVPVTLAYQDTPLETSTRRSWGWLVAVLAAVGILFAAWPLSSWQMRQSVAVESTGRMKCTESTAVKAPGIPVPAYRLVPGMHCRITYKVTNNAPLTAHLGAATFHLLGPATRVGLRAVDPDPQAGASADTASAVFQLDRDLDSGDSATFRVEAVFNPRGCNVPGSTFFVTQGPDVEVSFLNVSGAQTGNVTYALLGTKASRCQRPGS
jgi:hypothetical protein